MKTKKHRLLIQQKYKVGACTHKELAVKYFPYICPNKASERLKLWIQDDEDLLYVLKRLGWTPGKRMLTPLQVSLIMEAFGEP